MTTTMTTTRTTRAGDRVMAMRMRESIRGRRVVVVASGGRAVTRARAEVRVVKTRDAMRCDANGWETTRERRGDVSFQLVSIRFERGLRANASGTMTRAGRARAVYVCV